MVRVLPEKVRPQFAHAHLWRPCSFPNFFRRFPWQYGHSPKKVLDLLRRSKTWSLKHIGMAPFWKFRGRPQGNVAMSSCGRPWNSYDIARRLYRILRIATLLFILLLFTLNILCFSCRNKLNSLCQRNIILINESHLNRIRKIMTVFNVFP